MTILASNRTESNGIPSRNPKAEEALLGCILRDNSLLDGIAAGVGDMLYADSSRKIYSAMAALHSEGTPVDLVTLAERLSAESAIADLGGYGYFHDLLEAAPSATNAASYLAIIRESYARRQVRFAGMELAHLEESESPATALEKAAEVIATATARAGGTGRAKATCLADVAAMPVEWLWPRRIPRGTITLLDGDPGLGKSFITLDLAARVTCGLMMPPDNGPAQHGPASVLILNAEDDPARTIRPRLEAHGADLSRVFLLSELPDGAVTRPPVLPDDLPAIERAVTDNGVTLVVIDPLMAFLSGKSDSHKDSDIRRVLHRVKEVAERTQSAFLVVRHLNKLVGVAEPVYRGGGSIGIIGAARSALLVGRHPDDPDLRVVARSKGNLCAEPPALIYSLDSWHGSAIVQWHGESDLRAEDLLIRRGGGERGRPNQETEIAEEFLREALKGGAMPAKELIEQAKQKGIKERTLKRARKSLGVKAEKGRFAGGWVWSLPAEGCQNSGDNRILAPFGENPQKTADSAEGGQNSDGQGFLAPFGRNGHADPTELGPYGEGY